MTKRNNLILKTLYQDLVIFFGSQEKTATSLGVSQPAVSGWVTGVKLMSPAIAVAAERQTGGVFKAVDLCPALKEFQALA